MNKLVKSHQVSTEFSALSDNLDKVIGHTLKSGGRGADS